MLCISWVELLRLRLWSYDPTRFLIRDSGFMINIICLNAGDRLSVCVMINENHIQVLVKEHHCFHFMHRISVPTCNTKL